MRKHYTSYTEKKKTSWQIFTQTRSYIALCVLYIVGYCRLLSTSIPSQAALFSFIPTATPFCHIHIHTHTHIHSYVRNIWNTMLKPTCVVVFRKLGMEGITGCIASFLSVLNLLNRIIDEFIFFWKIPLKKPSTI